jgi:Lon-like protease
MADVATTIVSGRSCQPSDRVVAPNLYVSAAAFTGSLVGMARRRASAQPPPRRRVPAWVVVVVAATLSGVAGVALALVPSGEVALVPHAPIDLGGRIKVDGRRPEPLHGKLFLVGVEERKVSMLQKLYLGMDESVAFEPVPTPAAQEIQQRRAKRSISSSKEIAVALALELLGEPVRYEGSGAYVKSTVPGTPGGRLLLPGDRIVRMDGVPVVTSADVTRRVSRLEPGTRVELGVRRDGRPAVVTLSTVAPVGGDETNRSRIGVTVETPDLRILPSRKVSFSTRDVVGPSAGLAFALAAYDALAEDDLVRGRHMVASGALTLDGAVVQVGSVREKAIAAQNAGRDMFVVPTANATDAVRGVQLACDEGQECTRVLPVQTMQQAVALLELGPAELEPHLAN